MKKTIILALVIALMGVFLCACSSEEDSSSISWGKDNKSYTLNAEDYSIYDGRFTYKTKVEEVDNGTLYTFTYPDSSTWSVKIKTGGDIDTGITNHSEDYGDPRYADGEVLYEAYTMLKPMIEDNGIFNIKITPIKVVVGVVVIALGVILIAFPYKIWHIYEGWKFEGEVEPSDTYIGMTVASGVFIIIVTVVLVLFA